MFDSDGVAALQYLAALGYVPNDLPPEPAWSVRVVHASSPPGSMLSSYGRSGVPDNSFGLEIMDVNPFRWNCGCVAEHANGVLTLTTCKVAGCVVVAGYRALAEECGAEVVNQ